MKLTDPYFRLEFEERRRQAMTRDCPDCPALAGQECINLITGKPYVLWPAHARRERA